MMLLIPILMWIYMFLDISDMLWISYASHLLTSIVKAVAFKAGLFLQQPKVHLKTRNTEAAA